jgi:hypothetical protein
MIFRVLGLMRAFAASSRKLACALFVADHLRRGDDAPSAALRR